MNGARIESQMGVRVDVREDEVGCISYCPALDVRSQGDTEQEALDNLSEALRLFILSYFERGRLERVLKDRGFEARDARAP